MARSPGLCPGELSEAAALSPAYLQCLCLGVRFLGAAGKKCWREHWPRARFKMICVISTRTAL